MVNPYTDSDYKCPYCLGVTFDPDASFAAEKSAKIGFVNKCKDCSKFSFNVEGEAQYALVTPTDSTSALDTGE